MLYAVFNNEKAHMKETVIFPGMQQTQVESAVDCGPLVNLVADEDAQSGPVIAKSYGTKVLTILF